MKALTVPAYGQLVLSEVEAPTPGADDVVVQVVSASLNAADWHLIFADPFPVRLGLGLFRPKFKAAGADASGKVVAVGAAVTEFKVGDEVMGDLSGVGFGAFAEQACAPATAWVKKPASLSFDEAAAIPLAGMTALKGLRDVAGLKSGERVLVIGAAGGVGSFAVQIARALGAHVTAACRKDKCESVASLGVTETLPSETLEAALRERTMDKRFDVIFDCAAFRSPFAYNRLLTPGGRFVVVGGSMLSLMRAGVGGPVARLFTGHHYRTFLQKANPSLLRELIELVTRANIRPLLDKTFPLAEGMAALRHLTDRKARGKVVIRVSEPSPHHAS
ncbi:MAG: NAD(P)-dependent alcohol dehydrogenase [Myxococcaceae bacterium]